MYWQFIIMQNNADSTVLYESDWRYNYVEVYIPETGQTEKLPVATYGRDSSGNPRPTTDTITAADLAQAGIVNNYANGYKLKINQKYYNQTAPNYQSIETVILEQISPVFFQAADFPTINVEHYLSVCGRYAHFQTQILYNGIWQPNYDPIITKRERIAYAENPEENVISEKLFYIPMDNDSRSSNFIYGILDNHKEYAFRADCLLESGLEITSGWVNFRSEWTDTALDYVHLRVYYVRDTPATFIRLEVDDGYDESIVTDLPDYQRWTIYRVRTDTGEKEKVAIIPNGQNAVYDFGLKNNTEYVYRAYYGLGAQDGYMYESRPIKMRYYWNWSIVECEKVSGVGYFVAGHPFSNPMYHVKRIHQFQANVDSGSISNENTPYVENNFTPYPTVQKVGRKGLSGKLRAWVGGVKDTQFRDSVQMVDDLMDLSTRNTVKFLRDRKGNLRMIEISDAIVKETQDKYAEQPVQIEIPWVEVGDAKDCQIVSLLTDGLMARGDDIIDTTTAISVDQDGFVTWTMNDDGYVGSEIQMSDGGQLEQVYDNSMEYVPADLEIDNEGKLKVETVIKADE
jgi:hypothetical protein